MTKFIIINNNKRTIISNKIISKLSIKSLFLPYNFLEKPFVIDLNPLTFGCMNILELALFNSEGRYNFQISNKKRTWIYFRHFTLKIMIQPEFINILLFRIIFIFMYISVFLFFLFVNVL